MVPEACLIFRRFKSDADDFHFHPLRISEYEKNFTIGLRPIELARCARFEPPEGNVFNPARLGSCTFDCEAHYAPVSVVYYLKGQSNPIVESRT